MLSGSPRRGNESRHCNWHCFPSAPLSVQQDDLALARQLQSKFMSSLTNFWRTMVKMSNFGSTMKKTCKHKCLTIQNSQKRARQDSNLQPSDSKSGTLSNWATGAWILSAFNIRTSYISCQLLSAVTEGAQQMRNKFRLADCLALSIKSLETAK